MISMTDEVGVRLAANFNLELRHSPGISGTGSGAALESWSTDGSSSSAANGVKLHNLAQNVAESSGVGLSSVVLRALAGGGGARLLLLPEVDMAQGLAWGVLGGLSMRLDAGDEDRRACLGSRAMAAEGGLGSLGALSMAACRFLVKHREEL